MSASTRSCGCGCTAAGATRAQADRVLYKQAIRSRLENAPNLTLFQQAVDDLTLDGDGAALMRMGVFATLGTWSMVYLFTGEPLKSLGATLSAAVFGMIAYYIHERVWNHVSWGRPHR